MTTIPQVDQEPGPVERARDYLAKATPVNQLPPSQLMLDLQLARTHIELLLREIGDEAAVSAAGTAAISPANRHPRSVR